MVVVRFEIFSAVNCTSFRRHHSSKVIQSKVNRSISCLINISLYYLSLINNLYLDVTVARYQTYLVYRL